MIPHRSRDLKADPLLTSGDRTPIVIRELCAYLATSCCDPITEISESPTVDLQSVCQNLVVLAIQNGWNCACSTSFILISWLTFLPKNLCCLLYGPGKARFENREVPPIEDPHDILVRISYVGVCGSDVSIIFHPVWHCEHILTTIPGPFLDPWRRDAHGIR